MGQALTWHGLKSNEWESIGHDNRQYVAKLCRKHGELGRPLAVDYMRVARQDHVTANRRLRALSEHLELGKTGLTATVHDAELKKWCERHASEIAESCDDWTRRVGVREAISYARKRLRECGLTFPDGDFPAVPTDEDYAQALARVFDPKWWRLQVRKIQARKIEAVAREIRLVHKDAGIYASHVTVNRRRAQKARNYDALTNMEAVNDDGDAVNLVDLVKSSVSNPVNRRAELMVRIKGFEQCAEAAGHVGVFITLTAPSKYHRMTYIASWGKAVPNKKHEKLLTATGEHLGYSPRDAQQYFCRLWAQIRAQLWREEIRPYGFRVAEPHHDGTPHWHMLLFVEPEQAERLNEIMQDYGTREDGKERGAMRQRVKVVNIDPEKGSAAGYIAKYVAKNIDGHAIDSDLYGKDAKDSSARIDAWAAAWGIRQFQQIGGASVTVWRELRRLKIEDIKGDGDSEEAWKLIETFEAADSADWAAYTMLQGGMTVRRDEQFIRSHYQDKGRGVYYQPVKKLVGVIARGFGELATRLTEWVIQKAGTAAKQAERARKPGGWKTERWIETSEGYGGAPVGVETVLEPFGVKRQRTVVFSGGEAATWTRGNNCTPVQGLHGPRPPGGGAMTAESGLWGFA